MVKWYIRSRRLASVCACIGMVHARSYIGFNACNRKVWAILCMCTQKKTMHIHIKWKTITGKKVEWIRYWMDKIQTNAQKHTKSHGIDCCNGLALDWKCEKTLEQKQHWTRRRKNQFRQNKAITNRFRYSLSELRFFSLRILRLR